jgi:hypothetical protein
VLEKITEIVMPFKAIASELRIMRELYELSLAERGIHRVTEKPSIADTEVSYMGDPPRKPNEMEKLIQQLREDREE